MGLSSRGTEQSESGRGTSRVDALARAVSGRGSLHPDERSRQVLVHVLRVGMILGLPGPVPHPRPLTADRLARPKRQSVAVGCHYMRTGDLER